MSKRSVEKRVARKRELERARRQRARRVKQIRVWVSAGIAVAVVIVAIIFGIKASNTKPTASASSSPTPSTSASPSPTGTPCTGATPPKASPKTYKAFPPTVIKNDKKYAVTMETSCGTIHMTLDPKVAPKGVNNFVYLVQQKFYDGLTFHRIEENPPFQLIQGGDPAGNGTGGPGYQFVIEKPKPSANDPYVRPVPGAPAPQPGQDQQVTYLKGVLAMANSGGTATNGSQFFIDVSDVQLAASYTVLGKADAASLAVLQKMIKVPVSGTTPAPPVYILKVTVKEI